MIELEIPTLATLAAVVAFDGRADDEDRIYAAIEASAPIIVAAKLRQIATQIRSQLSEVVRPDPGAALASRAIADDLDAQADELHPPAVGT